MLTVAWRYNLTRSVEFRTLAVPLRSMLPNAALDHLIDCFFSLIGHPRAACEHLRPSHCDSTSATLLAGPRSCALIGAFDVEQGFLLRFFGHVALSNGCRRLSHVHCLALKRMGVNRIPSGAFPPRLLVTTKKPFSPCSRI